MTRTELEKRLLGARDCEAALAALADFFTAHELVFGHGTDNASDEAFWLLRHAQRLARRSRLELSARARRHARGARSRGAQSRVAQAARLSDSARRGSPGLRFAVDERVLVPRSPLAEVDRARLRAMVRAASRRPRARHRHGQRLHRDRGCALLSRTCSSMRPTCPPAALEVAAANVARHALARACAAPSRGPVPAVRRSATA